MMMQDPMSQYDPATQALILGQMSPQHRVAQALMGQQQGGGMAGLGNSAIQALMMAKGKPSTPSPMGPDPVMGTGMPASPMDQASSLSYLQKPPYPPGYGPMGGR